MLTESQIASWGRTRTKGRKRVLVEQFLAWTFGVGGGLTIRAGLKKGADAARGYWTGDAARSHMALAVLAGAGMAFLVGVLSWNRMERLFGQSTAAGREPPPERTQ